MEWTGLTLNELAKKLAASEVSSREVTEAYLARIDRMDPRLAAYTGVFPEHSLREAEEADRRRRQGDVAGPLDGVPVAIKDNICTRGLPTTCASGILKGFIPPYDATVTGRLLKAGAVVMGKTNMDEFAMGSSTENSGVKTTRNPWDTDRIPGGSSGGSAAAVAADLCAGALGSDTGGSIRQPAAMCGVVGLKPTYGRVSRYGLVAFASSLDQIGPLTKNVEDCALLMNVIAGPDDRDSTSAGIPCPDFLGALAGKVDGLKVGIPREYFIDGMDSEVEASVREAVRVLEKLGARPVEIGLPHTPYAVATYYILATAEASSNLARYDGVRYGYRTPRSGGLMEMYQASRSEGFGPEVKRRIMLGTYALSAGYYDAYYRKAQCVRSLIKRDFDQAFETVDVILTPTAPTAAFRIGEKSQDPLRMYLSDIFTISVNLAGIPAVSVPCGFTSEGLPIGLQILGKPFDEATILCTAYRYERETEWNRRKPPGGHEKKET
jgi:aspartyl-tRNA(Asn)/glutamyl-tRNA(Gln) amidotransferase subunit A